VTTWRERALDRRLQLRRAAAQGAPDSLFDGPQAPADRLSAHSQQCRRRGDVSLRIEVGAQRLPRHRATVALLGERDEVDLSQRGDQEVVAKHRSQQRHLPVAHQCLAVAQGDRQRRLGLAVAEAPAGEAVRRLADRQGDAGGPAAREMRLELGDIERAAAPEPEPDRHLVALDHDVTAIECLKEAADCLHRPRA
jgi:hypothetical protein